MYTNILKVVENKHSYVKYINDRTLWQKLATVFVL